MEWLCGIPWPKSSKLYEKLSGDHSLKSPDSQTAVSGQLMKAGTGVSRLSFTEMA